MLLLLLLTGVQLLATPWSPPGSSVYRILQTRILVGMSSNLGNEPMSPVSTALTGNSFTTEPPGKPHTCHTFYHTYRLHPCLLHSVSLITTMTLVKITVNGDCSHEIRWLLFGRKAMTNLDSVLKGKDITLPLKNPYSQNYTLSTSHVWMWELDHRKGRALKNWCLWNVVLEKTLESPLDRKELKPVNCKRNQPQVSTGRTDTEAEAPVLCPPDVKIWLIRKDPYDGKDWREKGKRVTEDEMVGWHHQLNGHDFEQTPGDGEGQRGLACCSQ